MRVPFCDVRRRYRALKRAYDSAYQRVVSSGQFVLGAEVDAFEREFSAYCEAPYAIAVGNGLDALRLILRGYGIGPGCEVIVPAHTFVATWLAVSESGATPVPVEVDPRTLNIDPQAVARAVTGRTRAVIVVHLYGHPVDVDAVADAIGGRHRHIKIIEDAAQAHGARYKGRRVGSLGDAAAFSFYPTKNLGCFGDGGCVVTGDAELEQAVRLLRNYGSVAKYRHEVRGANSRLDEVQAAFLRAGLQALDDWNARRRRHAEHYDSLLRGSGLRLPSVEPWAEPVWHLYTLRVSSRAQVQTALKARGVDTAIHYPVPPHLQPAYADLGVQRGAFPIAESACEELLSLPMDPYLDEAEVAHVAQAVTEAVDALAPEPASRGAART